MGPSGIESVGAGTVSAYADGGSGCGAAVMINGQIRETIDVEDGDAIDISLHSNDECSCCETHRNCEARNAGFWVLKNTKEKGTIAIDKSQINERLKTMAINMAKRKMGLKRSGR